MERESKQNKITIKVLDSVRKCIICDSITPVKLILSNKDSHIVRCKKCGLLYDNNLKFIESEENDIYSDGEGGHYPAGYVQNILAGMRVHLKLELIKNIKEFVPRAEGKKLLDIGCSIGDFLEIASNNGFEVFGVDISENACKMAKVRNKKAEIFKGEVFDANFPYGYFDVVNISAVLVHAKTPGQLIAEVYRILKPGGFLFIDEGSYESFRFYNFICRIITHKDKNYRYFINFFTLNTFPKFIATSPFKILKIFPYYYSDKLSKLFFPDQDNILVKFFLGLLSLTKVDKLMKKPRLFQAVLTKQL
jgi:ubiquinone/menaquinone biosynthesis C-methylase UbiE